MGSGGHVSCLQDGRPECVGEKGHEIRERTGIIQGSGGAGVGGGQELDSLSEDLKGQGFGW